MKLTSASLLSEIQFSASRSGGPGGQHVNKVNSKVTLRWNVAASELISPEQKEVLLRKLGKQLSKEGALILAAQDKRSQIQNKEEVLKKFDTILKKAFTVRKARRATKPTKTSIQNRIKEKKQRSEKKQWRKGL